MKIKVQVTEDDIENGYPSSMFLCPVAFALQRSTGTEWQVARDRAFQLYYEVALPESVTDWIDRFDLLKVVKPISFEIETP